MNFEQKYLKYKYKYIELKKQTGGTWTVQKIKTGSNNIRINSLPQGTTITHLETFLKSRGIPLSSPGMQIKGKNDFLVNFIDNQTAIQNYILIIDALSKAPIYSPTTIIPPVVTSTPFIQPWSTKSKLLFIALPITLQSKLGSEIDTITKTLLGTSPYNNTGNNTLLKIPHITLLQIFIPIDSPLDIYLSNSVNFNVFVADVRKIFIDKFNIRSAIPIQLQSDSNYKQLDKWVTQVFDDPTNSIKSSNYEPFRKEIGYTLLSKIKFFPSARFTHFINTEKGLPAYYYPLSKPGQTLQTFTHYSMRPDKYPKSVMAISSFYTEWLPHISVNKTNDMTFITKIKALRGNKSSYINLWNGNQQKNIPMIGLRNGSLSYIYCAYDKQFKYEPL